VLIGTGPGFRNDEARDNWNRDAYKRAERLAERGLAALGRGAERREGEHRDATGLVNAARYTLTQRDARVIDGLTQIAVPTLVVVGADDTAFLGAADYMTRKIQHARKVVIPGAGHAPNVSQPEIFDSEVGSFLRELSDPREPVAEERS